MNVSAPTDYRFPFDEPVLLAINGLQWDWLDAVWVALSDKAFGIGCAAVLCGWILATHKLRAVRPVLQSVAAIVLSDSFGHQILKPLAHRMRPCFAMPAGTVRQLWDASPGSLSMPSLHAATGFAFATALGLAAPATRRLTFAVAALIALSRLGCGVHWPSDAIAGALYGMGVGWLAHQVGQRFAPAPALGASAS